MNYETKGRITPDKKDGTTGNRYYTIDTFTQIRTIRVFQDLGLSLNEIRTHFSDTTDLQPMINRLEKMKDEPILTIEKLKERTQKKGMLYGKSLLNRRRYTAVRITQPLLLKRQIF